MYFGSYGLRKPRLDKCLKIPDPEDPSKCNMANGAKHSLGNMQNLRTVCEHIDCRSQVFVS